MSLAQQLLMQRNSQSLRKIYSTVMVPGQLRQLSPRQVFIHDDPNRLITCRRCGARRGLSQMSPSKLCPTCYDVSRVKRLTKGDHCSQVGQQVKLLDLRKFKLTCAKHDCPGCTLRTRVLQEGFIPTNVKQLRLHSKPR